MAQILQIMYAHFVKNLFYTLCCVLIFLLAMLVIYVFVYEVNSPKEGIRRPLLGSRDVVMDDVRELTSIVGRLRNEVKRCEECQI